MLEFNRDTDTPSLIAIENHSVVHLIPIQRPSDPAEPCRWRIIITIPSTDHLGQANNSFPVESATETEAIEVTGRAFACYKRLVSELRLGNVSLKTVDEVMTLELMPGNVLRHRLSRLSKHRRQLIANLIAEAQEEV